MHLPRSRVVPEEEKYFVDSGRFHHFLMVDITHRGGTFTLVDTDEKSVRESWPARKR